VNATQKNDVIDNEFFREIVSNHLTQSVSHLLATLDFTAENENSAVARFVTIAIAQNPI